jgi:hypothetical protein
VIFLQCLTEVTYLAPPIFASLGAIAAWRTLRRDSRRGGVYLGVSLAVAFVALVPLLRQYALVAQGIHDFVRQSVYGGDLSLTRLPEALINRRLPASADLATIALIACGAVVAAVRRLRGGGSALDAMWSTGALWTAVGVVLSISTSATLFGRGILTPRRVAANVLPGIAALRGASRFGTAALFGAAILAAAAFVELCRALGRLRPGLASPWMRVALAGAVVFASVWLQGAPVPWHTAPAPTAPEAFVAALRERPGAVVALPTGRRLFVNDPRTYAIDATHHAREMLESIAHQQPLLNGYSSYFPEGFAEEMELANKMPNAVAVRALVLSTGVRYVWVRLDELSTGQAAPWMEAATAARSDLRLVARDDGQLLFAVEPTAEP